MASTKTDHLPLIPAGIIWDGVARSTRTPCRLGF